MTAGLCAVACGSRRDFSKQAKALQSIRATTGWVADSWVSGQVSTAYARAALDRAFQLSEATRAELASTTRTINDPQASALAQGCEGLSRHIAALAAAVDSNDRAAASRLRRDAPNSDGS